MAWQSAVGSVLEILGPSTCLAAFFDSAVLNPIWKYLARSRACALCHSVSREFSSSYIPFHHPLASPVFDIPNLCEVHNVRSRSLYLSLSRSRSFSISLFFSLSHSFFSFYMSLSPSLLPYLFTFLAPSHSSCTQRLCFQYH